MSIICDRCGREMNDRWENDDIAGDGGNCTNCGDNLCAECAGKWNEYGECERCGNLNNKTIEELDFMLPLGIFIKKRKIMPCPDCMRRCYEDILYRRNITVIDCGAGKDRTRSYSISYKNEELGKDLICTHQHKLMRDTFVEAVELLEKLERTEQITRSEK
jgi:DNA-directed RNA polymerase subunit RPC12/RpoP